MASGATAGEDVVWLREARAMAAGLYFERDLSNNMRPLYLRLRLKIRDATVQIF